MRFLISAFIAVGVMLGSLNLIETVPSVAAQDTAGCQGSWLVRINILGRDVIEDGLLTFNENGDLNLVGPPVVPPLPDTVDDPLYVSNGVGHWQETDAAACTFDVVRLIGDADGNGLGAIYWRGSATVDPATLALSANFEYFQSTPLGQTIANGSGRVTGSSLEPAVSAWAPSAQVRDLTSYENAEYGFRLVFDPSRWQVQSQSASSIYLTDGNSIVSIGGSRALPTDATACVDESLDALSVTSARQDYAPLLDPSGNPVRRDTPFAAYAVFTYLDRSGDNRFDRVECRTLPEGRGAITVLQTGARDDVQEETINVEALLAGLDIE